MAFNMAGAANDIKSTVESYAIQGGAVVEEEINRISTNLVDTARGIFIALAVVFIVLSGYVWWGAGGDPQKMMFAKRMLAGFVVCMIFVFYAEKLVGGLLGILGYSPA